ncbi:hypothetical protein EDD86DRAFT_246666 [Gorgonomyces haynaldii]|nr:hypothetical protein EDD86DRAFT_246666 [Gorgonomyces haynaldii]
MQAQAVKLKHFESNLPQIPQKNQTGTLRGRVIMKITIEPKDTTIPRPKSRARPKTCPELRKSPEKDPSIALAALDTTRRITTPITLPEKTKKKQKETKPDPPPAIATPVAVPKKSRWTVSQARLSKPLKERCRISFVDPPQETWLQVAPIIDIRDESTEQLYVPDMYQNAIRRISVDFQRESMFQSRLGSPEADEMPEKHREEHSSIELHRLSRHQDGSNAMLNEFSITPHTDRRRFSLVPAITVEEWRTEVKDTTLCHNTEILNILNKDQAYKLSKSKQEKLAMKLGQFIATPASHMERRRSSVQSRRMSVVQNDPVIKQVRNKWKMAYTAVKFGLRLSYIYKDIVNSIQNMTIAPSQVESAILHQLRSFADTGSDILTLMGPKPETRRQEDIEMLERLLTHRHKGFSKFKTTQRLQFCELMTYERHQAGHTSTAFYFILSGQVEIFKIKDGLKFRVGVMNAGTSFGDRTMMQLHDKRTACVASTTIVELLKIDKADYFKIAVQGQHSEKIISLNKIHMFKDSSLNMEKAATFFKLLNYEKDEVIFQQDSQLLELFWIVQGSVRVVGSIPFMTKRTQIGRKIVTQMRECLLDEKPGQDETYTPQLLTLHTIDEGCSFPPMPCLDENDPMSWCSTSFVADKKCYIASIQFVDFCSIAPPELLLDLLQHPHVAPFNLLQIQQAYLSKVNWESHKKSVLKKIIS